MPRTVRRLYAARTISQPGGDGALRLWSRRIPLLRVSLARTHRHLRHALYPPLAEIANRWETALGRAGNYPLAHTDYLAGCHAAGQNRPTPLLLKYVEGDYNCLHQDIYGELLFPLQATLLLSAPTAEFSGGEFVMTEQRPRKQSRVEVVPLVQGEAVIFAVNQRPVNSLRGVSRVTLRHGVSRLRSGQRFALGVIFHDAK